MKKKFDPLLFVGALFTAIGMVFLPIGIVLGINQDRFFLFCFGLIGSVFVFIGILLLSVIVKKNRMKKELTDRGYYVTADITEITYNGSVTVNGRHPYVIQCAYEDPYTNEFHLFRSEDLPYDPSPMLKGDQIRVFVDPEDFDRYYVDIDSALLPVSDHRGLF